MLSTGLSSRSQILFSVISKLLANSRNQFSFLTWIYFMCVCVEHTCGGQKQLTRAGFLLLPCGASESSLAVSTFQWATSLAPHQWNPRIKLVFNCKSSFASCTWFVCVHCNHPLHPFIHFYVNSLTFFTKVLVSLRYTNIKSNLFQSGSWDSASFQQILILSRGKLVRPGFSSEQAGSALVLGDSICPTCPLWGLVSFTMNPASPTVAG